MELLNSIKKTIVEEAKPAQVTTEKKVEATKETKPVAIKIKLGHVHMSGCTGCLVSLVDN